MIKVHIIEDRIETVTEQEAACLKYLKENASETLMADIERYFNLEEPRFPLETRRLLFNAIRHGWPELDDSAIWMGVGFLRGSAYRKEKYKR